MGKVQEKKDLTKVPAAQHVSYAAQTTFIGKLSELHNQAERAIYTHGPAFLNVMSPCPRGRRYEAAGENSVSFGKYVLREFYASLKTTS